jgi:hypothetical protein
MFGSAISKTEFANGGQVKTAIGYLARRPY